MALPNRRGTVDREEFSAAYLERLRSGDAETERHFSGYFGRLVLLKARARSCCHAEDVRQETFLRVLAVLRSPEGLRDPGCLGAFVSRVCSNVILEHRRDHDRHPSGVAPEEPSDAGTSSPEEQAMQEQRRQAVRRVLGELRPHDRELLSALLLRDEDRDRICAERGVTRDALRVLLLRARMRFRAAYESDATNRRERPS
jgi:RNA polymerase sigma-70 factor, ECF subfamily